MRHWYWPYIPVQAYSRLLSLPQCCWNCGRKASETCSGCNAARYCGSFCQHKDWERHHLICSPGLQAQPKPVSAITASRAAAAAAAAGVSPVVLAGVKAPESVPSVSSPGGEKASVASRSSTPSTPASAPETNGHWGRKRQNASHTVLFDWGRTESAARGNYSRVKLG